MAAGAIGPPAGLENASANGYSMIERRGLRSAAGDKKMGSSLGPFFADTWSFRSADTQVIVLFSVVNPTDHNILLMPPQVQLGGRVKSGKIIRRSHWSSADQLPVMDFRLSKRRLGPGERADGVALFERPPYKQSNETLFLQVAEAGAVDRPALAPIGFGISTLREESDHGKPTTGK